MNRTLVVCLTVSLGGGALAAPQADAQGLFLNSGSAGIDKINEATGVSMGTLVATGSTPGTLFPTFGMAFGPSGDLFVASGNHSYGCEILRYSVTGTFKGAFVSPPVGGSLPHCNGVVFGPGGDLYTSDLLADVIERYNGQTGASMGHFVAAGSGGLNGAASLAFGPDGDLYVASLRNHGVYRYNGTTGAYVSTFVTAHSGGLESPIGLAFGPDGNLYVTSYFSPNASTVIRYNGQTGAFIDVFISATETAKGGLSALFGITFGPDERLYVVNQDGPASAVVRYNARTGMFVDKFVTGIAFPQTVAFTPRGAICGSQGNVLDLDRDGLLDCWETAGGIDFDGDGTLDLRLEVDANGNGVIDPEEKADPRHKDIFVEVDWMELHSPDVGALAGVTASFANSPVMNLDGTTGVRLHILRDEQAAAHAADLTFPPKCSSGPIPGLLDFDGIKAANFGTAAERASANVANILGAKRLAYHYSFFAHAIYGNSGLSGCAELPGNDFVVSLGGWLNSESNGNYDHQAATFMHELGHNLGLWHGGMADEPATVNQAASTYNCKPNYLSVMNYTFQYDNAWVNGRPLDFSRNTLLTLDKNHLDETKGIGGAMGDKTAYGPPFTSQGYTTVKRSVDASGAINWNGGGIDTDVSAPGINRFPMNACPGAGTILKGHDDWSNLLYEFRTTTDYADSIHQSAPEEADLIELLSVSPDDDADTIPNLIDNCPLVANANQADADGNGIGDFCDPASASAVGFTGFFQPIDMSTPTLVVWNNVNAGRALPVKWRLTFNGIPVADPDSFAGLVSYQVNCSSGNGSIDTAVEEFAPGDSGLVYKDDGNWQFNWKTLAGYKGTCRVLAVKSKYGTTSPGANFKFK
jgi:hypothetical protein